MFEPHFCINLQLKVKICHWNRRKMSIHNRSEFSNQKVHITGLYAGLKFAIKITFTKTNIFMKCKYPDSYSTVCCKVGD